MNPSDLKSANVGVFHDNTPFRVHVKISEGRLHVDRYKINGVYCLDSLWISPHMDKPFRTDSLIKTAYHQSYRNGD